MIPEGNYLLSHVGFSRTEKPLLIVQQQDEFISYEPLDFTGSLIFNMSIRYCIGWHDIATGENAICPTAEVVDAKYEQCSACQKRTGFNPAFYNATSVSEQQQQRNLEPHTLYLAYFGGAIIKVGITHTKRGYRRLLEQGARCALILDTFPTALIARQYEAQIAQINGIAETIQLKKKIELLTVQFDRTSASQALLSAKRRIEDETKVSFSGNKTIYFDDRYFIAGMPSINTIHDCTNQAIISGKAIAIVGSLLLTMQEDDILVLPLKKFIGYRVSVSHELIPIDTPAQQISLF